MNLANFNSAAFTNTTGLVVAAGASIEVRRESDNGLAALFSEKTGTTGVANPFTADAQGRFTFYVVASPPDGYKVTVTKDSDVNTIRNVAIGNAQYRDIEDYWNEFFALTTDAAVRAALAIAGKQSIPIPVTAMTPRSANGCAPLAASNGASNQPDVPYLAFDGAAKEYAGFLMRMPKSWNEGTVTMDFAWRRASGTGAADVVWGFRAVAVADNDTPAANFGSDATVTDAASTTTANFNLSAETGAGTIAGSPGAGELVFFEVFRDGAAGGDTLNAVDAWLTHVTLHITTDETNDA